MNNKTSLNNAQKSLSQSSLQFTRREILAAFLGLPLAIAACKEPPPPFPEGQIVGPTVSLGHKLRDGINIKPNGEPPQRYPVIIVGGGVAGLSAAWRFLKAGFRDFLLLELENNPGGTSSSGTSKIVAYPWGAHYIPVPLKSNQTLLSLFDEMGLLEGYDNEGEPIVAEQFLCRDPEERLFYRGRWYEGLYLAAGASRDDQAQFDAFHKEIDYWAAWRDSRDRRAFAIPMATASDDAEVTALDKITMAEWMKSKGWTSSRLYWLVDYSCRDDYGATIENTSAWAGLFYFVSRVKKSGKEAQPLVTWPEGNGHLVNHLYSKVKDNVRLGWAVAELIPTIENTTKNANKNNREGVQLIAVDHSGSSATSLIAEQVIFAAPQFLAKYLIRPYRDNTPDHIAKFEYSPWMVANLTLKDRPVTRGAPLAWDNVIYDSPALGYVVATHQKGIDYGPTIFTYYYPMAEMNIDAARKKLLAGDWHSWADVALTDLSRAHHDIRALTERLDVMRWAHAMIRPHANFVWGGARKKAQQPFRNIHFAHSDLSGVALFEEAFYQGIRAAEEILIKRNITTTQLY